jgi:hypothetical protein
MMIISHTKKNLTDLSRFDQMSHNNLLRSKSRRDCDSSRGRPNFDDNYSNDYEVNEAVPSPDHQPQSRNLSTDQRQDKGNIPKSRSSATISDQRRPTSDSSPDQRSDSQRRQRGGKVTSWLGQTHQRGRRDNRSVTFNPSPVRVQPIIPPTVDWIPDFV